MNNTKNVSCIFQIGDLVQHSIFRYYALILVQHDDISYHRSNIMLFRLDTNNIYRYNFSFLDMLNHVKQSSIEKC